jgi:hypothetical protein
LLRPTPRRRTGRKKAVFFAGTGTPAGLPSSARTLDVSIKPRGVSECLPTTQWQQRHIEVLAELRRRRTQQEQQETEAQARASSKDEGRSIAAFLESPVTIDDMVAAWMKVIAKKALSFDLVDDPIFRGAIELTARASWKIIAGGGVQLPKRKKMSSTVPFPPLSLVVVSALPLRRTCACLSLNIKLDVPIQLVFI